MKRVFHVIHVWALVLVLLLSLPGCWRRQAPAQSPAARTAPVETLVDIPQAVEAHEERDPVPDRPKEVAADISAQLAEKTEEPSPEQTLALDAKDAKKAKAAEVPTEEEEPSIEFNLENADLETLINQISDLFDLTFVADDSITPMLQGRKSVRGNKISFKTQRALTKKEAWNLFVTFLDIAGFTVINQADPRIKRIVTVEDGRRSPLAAYIGVPPAQLPNSDEMIRYVYFVENASLDTMSAIVDSLRSPNSSLALLRESKAFVLSDKAYNIKSLMNIVKELDRVTMPQAMSVLKLRRADATEVKKLYETLVGTDERSQQQQRMTPGRKASPGSYFPDNVGVFAEPRTNSLILLGPQDAIKRIEDFITQSVDVELAQPYSPLYVVPLRYANAVTVANIMNEAVRFGANTPAGQNGGVRGGDKYMKPITFTPEPETNRIVVKGDYEDYLRAKEIIDQLDTPQPQVAIEVMLLSVAVNENLQLGSQFRSREPGSNGLLGSTVKWQTSGLFGFSKVETNPDGPGVDRLLGNLLNLVSNGIAAGNTIISLGDSLSVWGIIQMLETISSVQVLSNPFLIATNKTQAQVSLGETRRVITGTIVGTQDVNTFGDAPANLTVKIQPQINSDGMIVLDLDISLANFVGQNTVQNAQRTTREIKTRTIVANKEVLALGGLIRNNIQNNRSQVPLLGDIPLLGWIFKNRQKNDIKENLLVLISCRIIEPDSHETLTAFTDNHITDYTDLTNQMVHQADRRDPISRWFFNRTNLNEKSSDEFVYRQHKQALQETKLKRDVVTPIAQASVPTAPVQAAPEAPKAVVAHAPRRFKNKGIRA